MGNVGSYFIPTLDCLHGEYNRDDLSGCIKNLKLAPEVLRLLTEKPYVPTISHV